MTVSGVTDSTLQHAADAVGVSLDISRLNPAGTRWRVKVNPGSDKEKYRRTSASYFRQGYRVNAVCWHGFRDFFREVFKTVPDAKFRTSVDHWKGSEDFESRYRDSAFKNIGPPIAPVYIKDACACKDSGNAY